MPEGRDLEDYSTGIAAVVASFAPFVGSAIAAGIAAFESRRVSNRVEGLVRELRDRAATLDEEKVDRQYLDSVSFQDLVVAALEAGRRTADADKRRLIAGILLGAAMRDRPKDLDVEGLMDTISGLSPEDLRLARHLYEEAGGEEPLAIVKGTTGPAHFPDRRFHLKRLEAAGLIQERTGAVYGYSGGEYLLTPTFHRLMALLRD